MSPISRYFYNLSLPFVWPVAEKSWAPGEDFAGLEKSLTFFPQERVSSARNTTWQDRLVRYPLDRWSKNIEKLAKFDFNSMFGFF